MSSSEVRFRQRAKLPQSEDAEKGVIASILLSPIKSIETCLENGVSSDWFHHPCRKLIYDALLDMRKLDKPIDLISATQFLTDRNLIDTVGGAAEVSELYSFIQTSSNLPYYLTILREKFALRSAMLACDRAREELAGATTLQEVFNVTSKAFIEVQEACVEAEPKDYDKTAMLGFLDKMEAISTNQTKPDLFPTYFPSLDEQAGGMMRGEVYVIHGATSTGKSITGQNILQRNVLEGGRKGAWYSFEMLYDQCMRRLVAAEGRISLKKMRIGRYEKGEFDRFLRASLKLGDAPLSIYDVKRCKALPSALEGSIRRHKKNQGLDIVLVDYLQLLKFKGKNDRRDQDLQEFSCSLKLLAGELDLVILLIAQANKEGSVFDGSQVESDADGVLHMTPTFENVAGIKKITGTDGIFVSKFREARRGWKLPVEMIGEFALIQENTSF